MASFSLGTLSQTPAFIFQQGALPTALQGGSDVALTTSGATTTLGMIGDSLALPTGDLSQAGLAGQVWFADGNHLMLGLNGLQAIAAGHGPAIIYGRDDNDQVATSNDPSYVYGGGGSDSISGGAGNDHLYGYDSKGGADGADTISGGDGGDYIQGNAGNDLLDGGSGDDRILGGADNDVIHGGSGNDAINGNFGNDVIDGGDGDDVVRGGKGDDAIAGGAGNDHLYGDLGADTLTGGGGADVFHFHGNDAAFVSTDLVTGHVDMVTDFTIGEDHLSLGFNPTDVIHGSQQSSAATALAYATSLLAGHEGQVVAVGVGSDTYLFYGSNGGPVVDSVVDLHNVSAPAVSVHDFV